MTSQPMWYRRSIVSLTARSLPGVVVVGHPPQRGQRLALGPGRDDHEPLVGPVVELARRDDDPVGHLDVPERAADVDVLAHRAPDERDLAPVRGGRVDDLLD